MAKLGLPNMFIRSLQGPTRHYDTRSFVRQHEERAYTYEQYQTMMKQKQTRAMQTRRERYERRGRVLTEPMTWKADCDAWKYCDSFYTSLTPDIKHRWRKIICRRRRSTYDEFMAWAIPHALRGLTVPPYPQDPTVRWLNRFENARWTPPRSDHPAFRLSPRPSTHTNGLYFARVFRYRMTEPGNPKNTRFYATWLWFQGLDTMCPQPSTAFYQIRAVRTLAPFPKAFPFTPIVEDASSWSPILQVTPDCPRWVVTLDSTMGGQLAWYLPKRHADGTLITPVEADPDTRILCGIITPHETFRHWPRMWGSHKGDLEASLATQTAGHTTRWIEDAIPY